MLLGRPELLCGAQQRRSYGGARCAGGAEEPTRERGGSEAGNGRGGGRGLWSGRLKSNRFRASYWVRRAAT